MIHRMLRLAEVKARTGLSRSTLYARIAQRAFPQQVHLGPRAVAWPENEVEEWLEKQIQESRKAA
jgi:prophage regulatory protein